MAVKTVGDNQLGLYLKIVSQQGVYGQLSENSVVWKNILKKKKSPGEGRERRYLMRSAYGSAAAQFVGVTGNSVAYPNAHQATLIEGVANYKDFALTVEVERAVLARALGDMGKYGEPLAEEIKCKTVAMSRMLSAAVYQDGTGVVATVASTALANGELVVTMNTGNTARGFVGWVEYGDKLNIKTTAGVSHNPTTSNLSYLAVTSVDRVNDKFNVAAYDATGAKLTIASGDITSIAAGDVCYRIGITAPDLTAISGSTEYGTLTEAFVGFESLFQDDGRKVSGVNLNAPIRGIRKDVGGTTTPIDVSHFQDLLSSMKVAVGEGAYKWTSAIMAPEILDDLIISRESDRRFISITDNKKGVASMGYVHGKDTVMFETDEFCPKRRIYVLPQSDVLQFYGSDFDWVKPEGGSKFFLKPSNGGHYRTVRAYMEGSGLLLCVHPQACGVIHNFQV